MGIFRSIKQGVSSHFSFKKRIGGHSLQLGKDVIQSSLSHIRSSHKREKTVSKSMTFDEFMVAQDMTETTWKEQVQYLRYSLWIYISVLTLLALYGIYLVSVNASAMIVFECCALFLLLLLFTVKAYIRFHLLSSRQLRTTILDLVKSLKFWK